MKKKWKRHALPRGKHVQILRSMKLCLLLVVWCVANVFGEVKSQTLTLDVKDRSLKEVFQLIEQNSSYRFLYKSDEIAGVTVDELKSKDERLEVVLQKCLSGTSLVYEKDGTLVIVKRREVMNRLSQHLKEIKGNVTDKSGVPISGVTVVIKGATIGVATDHEGNFKMEVPGVDELVLVFSFVGMQTQEVAYVAGQEVRVVMLEDMSELDEVVVTGYQHISRRELASAVKQIKAKDVMQNDKFSIDQMLAGQVAGMMVTQTSGEPGATPRIRIRGTSSIISSKAPLWVLDGIILDDPVSVDYSQLNGDDAAYLIGNAIAGINPQDIETITVLKDASATAIYGVQAANGVIVVSTKKGRIGRPRVSYNGTLALSQRESYGDLYLMNAGERVQLSQNIIDANLKYSRYPQGLGYEGLYMKYMNKDIDYEKFRTEVNRMVDRNTDWFDLLFRDVLSHSHTVSISGGDDKTTYYGSLGYADNLGTAKGSSSRRYTATLKLNSWLHPNVYVGLQVNGSINKNKGFHASTNPNNWAYTTSRTLPAYHEDGSLFFYETPETGLVGQKEILNLNYLNELKNTGNEGQVTGLKVKFDLRWNMWKGLRYDFSGSINQQHSKTKEWANDRSHYISAIRGYNQGSAVPGSDMEKNSVLPFGGELNSTNNEQTSYTLQNQLGYSNSFNGDHVMAVSAISEIRSVVTEGISARFWGWMPDRGQVVVPSLTSRYLARLAEMNPTITDNVKNYVSWIGSATYSYKDKWVANANIRMDGSNQFGDNPKYRFLPVWSVAGKYTLTQEEFLRNNRFLSYLSFRGSYGIQGNVDKSTSPDLVLKVGEIDANTSLPKSTIAYLPNPDLRWEKTVSYNIGLDFSLWEGRLSGVFDYYKKMGTDMIMSKQVSQVTGQQFVKINGGDLDNTGVEVDIIGYPVKTKNFEFGVGIMYSYNRNELKRANDGKEITVEDMIGGNALIVGQALGTIYSYRFAGLESATGLPLFYDKAGRSSTVIKDQIVPNYSLYRDEVDIVKSGVTTPSSSGSIKVHFRYKNLRLTGNFLYSFGGVGRLPAIYGSEYEQAFDPVKNVTKELTQRWKETGDERKTVIPALYDRDTYRNLPNREYMENRDIVNGISMYDYSDVRVAKTDNIRLGNLNLSYMFPGKIVHKIGAQDMMVSLQATNLFLITDKRWHGRDPETLGSNASLPKTYTLNLNISF